MKLKKGSAAAKAYMAKIRAKKKTAKKKAVPKRKVGATLLIEKGESKKSRPKKVVQIKRNAAGQIKSMSTIAGVKSAGKIILEEKIKNLYLRSLKASNKREKTKILKALNAEKRKLKILEKTL